MKAHRKEFLAAENPVTLYDIPQSTEKPTNHTKKFQMDHVKCICVRLFVCARACGWNIHPYWAGKQLTHAITVIYLTLNWQEHIFPFRELSEHKQLPTSPQNHVAMGQNVPGDDVTVT